MKRALIALVAALSILSSAPASATGIAVSSFDMSKCIAQQTCTRAPYTYSTPDGFWTAVPPYPGLAQALWAGGSLRFVSPLNITRITITYRSSYPVDLVINGYPLVLPVAPNTLAYSLNVNIPVMVWAQFKFDKGYIGQINTGQGFSHE